MTAARARTGVRDLRPVSAVPLPRAAGRCPVEKIATKQDDPLASGIVGRTVHPGTRPDVLFASKHPRHTASCRQPPAPQPRRYAALSQHGEGIAVPSPVEPGVDDAEP